MLFLSLCSDLFPFIKLVKTLIALIQIGIPIILIVLGMFDLGKAVVASKEDEIKSAQKLLIKRVIYAVAIFFVVFIVKVIFNTISDTANNANSWVTCWDCASIVTESDGSQHCNNEGAG